MPSFRELLKQTQVQIQRDLRPRTPRRRLGEPTFLDVREHDEYEQGTIPGSVFIPRGHLESQAENKLPDQRRADRRLLRRRHPLGVRRQDAAAARLHRRRVDGRRLRPLEERGPPLDHAGGAHARAAQPLRPPHPPPRGRRGRPAEAARVARCCCSARAASARPPRSTSRPRASARSASSTWTSSTRRTCSARSCTTSTASASARSTRRRRRSPRSTPTSTSSPTTCASAPTTCSTSSTATTSIVDGTDNFPTRYLLNDASLLKRIPVVHGSIFRFEGQVTVFKPYEGPCYRCLLPEPPPPELAP